MTYRDEFLMCVQTAAIVYAIRNSRGYDAATNVVGLAMEVREGDLLHAMEAQGINDPYIMPGLALGFVRWQMQDVSGGELALRPTWMPDDLLNTH